MGTNSIFLAEKNTDRTLIESILASHYILDYGFIKKVNDDKTIDVTHAKQLKTMDGTTLPATVTTGVEVLTLAGGGFSISFDYKKGDKVLLLGLKNYIDKVEDVTSATETTAYMHYSRETLKAIPLCVFNEDAKVTIKIEDGELAMKTGGKVTIESEKDVEVTAENITANCSTFAVKPKGGGDAALEVTP
jgi:NaMN:DMB phosphoribosyltransferase